MNADPGFSLENPEHVQGLDMAHDAERNRAAQLQTALEQAEYAATHDRLTGVLNLKGLEDHLTTLDNNDEEVAILFIDGDNMKAINDTLGHDAGDEAIIGTANTLQSCTRPQDIVARLGGDEFVIVLSSDKRDADKVYGFGQIVINTTGRLRQCVEAFKLEHPDLTAKGFDLSVGAAIRKPGDTFAQTKAAAESQMYEHKERQEKVSTAERQAFMATLARQAIAGGLSTREFAGFLRSYQPDEVPNQG